MKYIVVLGDGMADYPLAELDHKTPLQYAKKPNIDKLAKYGEVGMVKTIPQGIPPGSDAANLSVMGYDPSLFYTGRSPLEALSMGIQMTDIDVAIRCNFVTLSDEAEYSEKTMLDYCADEISTEEARQLIEEVNAHFKNDILTYYPGVSYRHCLIWKHGPTGCSLTPPHDIALKKITTYLPQGEKNKLILDMMRQSYEFLKDHPINQARIAKGLRPANSIWLWGEGKKPSLPLFYDKYQLKGSVISAVDLLKGIGKCAGLRSVDVPGATGNIHTNFLGKAEAALHELESGQDFVYLHIEAPDECGHRFEIDNKVRAIELIDEKVVATLLNGLAQFDDYKILLLPDHPTPLSIRTHTAEPVPFILYQKSSPKTSGVEGYDEFQAQKTGFFVPKGATLMDYFLKGTF